MEFDLVPQIIIIISAGIIIVILGRNIPKARDLNEENIFFEKKEVKKEKEKFFYLYSRIKERISKEKNQEKINLMWVWLEKTLLKIRISFLKIDNKITSLLGKLREKHIEAEIDKSEEADNIDKYKDIEKEEVEENQTKDKDEFWARIREKKDNEFLQKEAGVTENELQKSEISENIDINETKKVSSEDEKDNNISKLEKDAKEEAKAYSKKENAKGKEKEYLEMILKNPIDIKSYWKLGIVYSRRRNYKDAISCFRQITKIDPTYTKAKKKISDLMERMKEKKEDKKLKKENKKVEKEKIDIQE